MSFNDGLDVVEDREVYEMREYADDMVLVNERGMGEIERYQNVRDEEEFVAQLLRYREESGDTDGETVSEDEDESLSFRSEREE